MVVRFCPVCGAPNYDDLATHCITCGSDLPPLEEAVGEEVLEEEGGVFEEEVFEEEPGPEDIETAGGPGEPGGEEWVEEFMETTPGEEKGDESAGEEKEDAVEEEETPGEIIEETLEEELMGGGEIGEKTLETARGEDMAMGDDEEGGAVPEEYAEDVWAEESVREGEAGPGGETEEIEEVEEEAEEKEGAEGKKRKRGRGRATALDLVRRYEEELSLAEEEKGGLFTYWVLSMITLFYFVFIGLFAFTELLLMMFNITIEAPAAVIALSPVLAGETGISVLFVASLIAGIDAALHYWDSKINLTISLVPTGIMILGVAINAYEGAGTGLDIGILYALLISLIIMLAFDIICILEYPEILEETDGSPGLEAYMRAAQEMAEVQQQIEEEYQTQLAEEEEKLRLKEEELQRVREEIETLQNQLAEEEEKLRLKDEEISSIQAELELKKQELLEEEEKLRLKEENLDSVVRAEVERYAQEWLAEEEEKIRLKEEELARTRSELELQKKMVEELRERLRMKEYELASLRTELETQIRERLEEEEMLRLKETAARMAEKKEKKRVLFPFTAIVNQEKMKKALILNAVYPGVGGVLIRGQKGTGKSVTVRALAEVLPIIKTTGCRFNCDPEQPDLMCYECRRKYEMGKLEVYERPVQVVDLPLNVTEDRLVGSIDIEKILSEGVKSFEPGILAEAHRGILYVDEINLLDDYIVDILLDAAASGQVVVEREGVSVTYPSHFIIVGSMNPEEGELRPQLLDRIALQTEVAGIHDIEKRMEIIRRREEFTQDPEGFRAKYEPEQKALREKIEEARKRLPHVTTPERMLKIIARLCVDFDVDGHRADIIIERAARANAAFEGRMEVTLDDIVVAAEMALPHRMRKRPYAEERFDTEILRKWVKKIDAEI